MSAPKCSLEGSSLAVTIRRSDAALPRDAEHVRASLQVVLALLPACPLDLSRHQQLLTVRHPLSRRQRGPLSRLRRYEYANLVLTVAARSPLTWEQACRAAGLDAREAALVLRVLIRDAKIRPLREGHPLDVIDPTLYDPDHLRRGLQWKAACEISVGDYVAFPLPPQAGLGETVTIDAADHLDQTDCIVLPDSIYYGRGRRQYAEAFDYLRQHPERLPAHGKMFADGERRRLLEERGWSLRDFEDAQEQIKAPGAQRRWFPRFIAVDEAFAALCGYFVAEGYAGANAVVWHFHRDEAEYWTEMEDVLVRLTGRPGVLRPRTGNAVQYDAYSRPLALILPALFGSGAHSKCVPDWWALLPRPVLASFLRALFNGDGHVSRCGNRITLGLTTVSGTLAVQVRNMLLSLGVVSAIHGKPPQQARMRDGKVINSGPAFVVVVCGDEARALAAMFGYVNGVEPQGHRTLWYRDDRYLYLRVNSVTAVTGDTDKGTLMPTTGGDVGEG